MKVILLDEVKGKGREGEVVEVARGFAVNYLFPRKLAVQATSGNLKQLDARKGNIDKREEPRGAPRPSSSRPPSRARPSSSRRRPATRAVCTAPSRPSMIAEAIAAQLGVEVDRRRMDVHGHIKTTGEHPVTVAVHQDVEGRPDREGRARSAACRRPLPPVAAAAPAEEPAAEETAEDADDGREPSEAPEDETPEDDEDAE